MSTEGALRMQGAVLRDEPDEWDGVPFLEILVADDDPEARARLAGRALAALAGAAVLEAEDGAQAVQVALQRRPSAALLDVELPRLGGLDVAITLQALAPQMRLAVHAAEPWRHQAQAQRQGLPLFDAHDPDGAIRWLALQTRV